jgi:hypothetical protein
MIVPIYTTLTYTSTFGSFLTFNVFSCVIKDELELKTQKKARWKPALNASIKVINFVLMLVGLPTFLHTLPEGSEPRLIEDGSRKKWNR